MTRRGTLLALFGVLLMIAPAHAVGPGLLGSSGSAPALPSDLAGPLSLTDRPDSTVVFEPNVGQASEEVRFVARGTSAPTAFLDDGIATQLPSEDDEPGDRVEMTFLDGQPTSLEGHDARGDVANYYLGDDPSQWATEVPRYQSLVYEQVWPGIDVVVYGTEDARVEYDFVVAPGASPDAIRLAFDGQEALDIADDGALVIDTATREMRQQAPIAHQPTPDGHEPVTAAFEITSEDTVTLDLGERDPTLPLVIDPVLEVSSHWGASGSDAGQSVEIAPDGDIVIAGRTSSEDLPTLNATQPGYGGRGDAFVARFTDDFEPIWVTYLGGISNDRARDVAIDDAGNTYVTGTTGDTTQGAADFPTTPGAAYTEPFGISDGFIAKLDTDGLLEYATLIGSRHIDMLKGIDVDADGRAYAAGWDFWPAYRPYPTTDDAFQPEGNDRVKTDAVFTVLSPDGSTFEYVTYIGSTPHDRGADVAVTDDGRAYVTGRTHGDDLPVVSALQPSFGGEIDTFLAVFDPDQNVEALTYLGGAGVDMGLGVDLGPDDLPYLMGRANSPGFPVETPGSPNAGDGFLAKLDPAAQSFEYAASIPYVGTQASSWQPGFAVDDWGNAHVVGRSQVDIDEVRAVQDGHAGGTHDGIAVSLDADGQGFRYATLLGGSAEDLLTGVAVDDHGDAIVAGRSNSDDLPTADPLQDGRAGGFDTIIAKLHSGDAIADAWTVSADTPTFDLREHARAFADNNASDANASRALTAGPVAFDAGATRADSSIDRSEVAFDATATSSVSLADVSIADGLVTADAIEMSARSTGTLDEASSTVTGAITGLSIAAAPPVDVTFPAPEQNVSLPGDAGYVTVFETERFDGDGGYSEVRATALHVNATTAEGSIDVRIGVAWTAVAGDNLPLEHPDERAPIVCEDDTIEETLSPLAEASPCEGSLPAAP